MSVTDPARLQRVFALMEAALAVAPAERAAYLETACGGDATLQRDVEALLAADEAAGTYLETPAEEAASVVAGLDEDAYVGRRIGAYRLLRRIGRGGMGSVYLAEREDGVYHQQVAVKILRRGLDTEDVLRRFHAERQILASLNHPNIAQLLDGGMIEEGTGAPHGLSYFVMEYVDGLPITTYCDTHRLAVEDRLRLFQRVCQAVHHAHQHLVVHRDLKPSNILVVPETETTEAGGQVKLLDFGIAKILNPDLAGYTVPMTRAERRLMTPEYASPEQVRGEPVATTSDVYALGVLLYELLTGHRPYQLTQKSLDAVARIICEEDPTRPSIVVATTQTVPHADGTTRTVTPQAVGHARNAPTGRLQRRLKGELDNIVLMALRKEPHRRYTSAAQFAEDIQRHLDGVPILARNNTLGYRTRKYVQRYRWQVVALVLTALLLVGYAVTSTVQARRVAAEAQRAEQVKQFLIGLFEQAKPGAEDDGTTVQAAITLLEPAVSTVETDLADEPAIQAELLHTIGTIFVDLGTFGPAERPLRRALQLRRQLYTPPHPDLAASLHALGWLHFWYSPAPDSAVYYFRQATEMRRQLYGNIHPEVGQSLLHWAWRLPAGDSTKAALTQEALRILRAVHGPRHMEVGTALSDLGQGLGDADASIAMFEEALSIYQENLGPDHPRLGAVLNNLALATEQKDPARALDLLREAYRVYRIGSGPDHPNTLSIQYNLAASLYEQRRYAEAESLFVDALARRRRMLPVGRAGMGNILNYYGRLLVDTQRFAEAETRLREALTCYTAFPPHHIRVIVTVQFLARSLAGQGRTDEARHLLQTHRQAVAALDAEHAALQTLDTELERLSR